MTSTITSTGQKAIMAAAIASFTLCPFPYDSELSQVASFQIPPTTTFFPRREIVDGKPVLSAQEMIDRLRREGMPISAIADGMRVERKSIYAWLSGGEVRPSNQQRVEMIYSLLTSVDGVDARNVYRFWNTDVGGKTLLRDLITAENIDETAVREALESIRPTALRSISSERKMRASGNSNLLLDEIPEVGFNG